ncbi:MAG: hypothetical protein H0W34_05205 [Pyrinomonadaceae bacterium]|nr:hypothetical protein [Pyrinomonadaceae bacterium]
MSYRRTDSINRSRGHYYEELRSANQLGKKPRQVKSKTAEEAALLEYATVMYRARMVGGVTDEMRRHYDALLKAHYAARAA